MDKVKLSRKERERLRHRKYIITAARELFSQKGFIETSMQEIADAAEFSVGTLYKFFKNKDVLFETIVRELIEEKETAQQKIVEKNISAELKLRQELEHIFETIEKEKQLLSFYVSHIHFSSNPKYSHIISLINNHEKFTIENLAKIFQQGIDEHVFKDIDPYMMAYSFKGIVDSFVLRSADTLTNDKIFENTAQWMDSLFSILYFGIKH